MLNFKSHIILLLLCCSVFMNAQENISLSDALEMALQYKPSHKADSLKYQAEALSLKEVKALWWPEISVAYDYRFNAIIPTTILPVGEFDVKNPTNEVRGIKMGTKWQQNIALNLSQPLIDFSIGRKISQKKWEKRIASAQLEISTDDLIFEVANSYLTICDLESKIRNSRQDTLRTYRILQQQQSLYKQERLLVSDLNHAKINHNNAVNLMQDNLIQWSSERIYLAFLTGIPYMKMVYQIELSPINSDKWLDFCLLQQPSIEKQPLLQKLHSDWEKAKSDLRVEKAKSLPTLKFEASLGANQYDDCFSPAKKGTWYPGSYIGIAIKLPILYGENISARNHRLRLTQQQVLLEIEEQRNQYTTDALRALEKIHGLQIEIGRMKENLNLSRQAAQILAKRFDGKQASAFDLNLEELELQKNEQLLQEKESQLISETLNYLKNAGLIRSIRSYRE